MNARVQIVAFAVCVFASSIAGAIFVLQKLKTEAWENAIAITSSRNIEFDAQNAAALQLLTIEAAQRGDTTSILRTNCLLLRVSLRGLEPKAFGPAREAEVSAFIEHANTVIAGLTAQGLCDWRSAGK